jgi:hypothetical protein
MELPPKAHILSIAVAGVPSRMGIGTVTWQLHPTKSLYALCAMCIGVGQGIGAVLERGS